ncbi:hypothetical protein OS493_018506 [Desmophyllum pertusum]|uniref:DUF7869 domain-containing protein n=1 Tax=Desmophyllum pertusum TaxID=174260 RepID=A0A9X0A267_9CNID|nr:hypothetical protein OS493_018506 [Desmophyllum pertusum]
MGTHKLKNMFPKVLVLQLDYHKNLPCPKVSAQDSHYLRHLRTNLFGIYCANEDIIHCFFYDDSIGGAGPNEANLRNASCYVVQMGHFLRIDLKFLLEGHSYSICDRRFGCIQQFFNTIERVEVPKEWATMLKNSHLKNIEVHWVTLDMIKDYNSWFKMQYIARNMDEDKQKFEFIKDLIALSGILMNT